MKSLYATRLLCLSKKQKTKNKKKKKIIYTITKDFKLGNGCGYWQHGMNLKFSDLKGNLVLIFPLNRHEIVTDLLSSCLKVWVCATQ